MGPQWTNEALVEGGGGHGQDHGLGDGGSPLHLQQPPQPQVGTETQEIGLVFVDVLTLVK